MNQNYTEIFNSTEMVELQDILRKSGQTITTAESCTGGLIASMITEIPGSSDIFKGAVITYSNEVKERELNVKKETMITHGAVSEQTVKEMLQGAIDRFDADYAVAVSGVAGPTGGTKNKPVGTVVVGAITKKTDEDIQRYLFSGNRKEIQVQAAKHALKKIFKFIKNSLDK